VVGGFRVEEWRALPDKSGICGRLAGFQGGVGVVDRRTAKTGPERHNRRPRPHLQHKSRMKLIRHGLPGAEKPGLIDPAGTPRDLSGLVADIHPATLGPNSMARLAALDPLTLPPVPSGTRLGPCVGGVGNVVAIGLNYADHAAEAGLKAPGQPIVFNKHTASISGPNDDIRVPPGSEKLDWEVELGIVIGQRTFHVSESQAMDHVAGFCLVNDVSERAYQMEHEGQWVG
jgi:2,4-didehydro-3-deoxy-L-rhamnonate hydrolase